MDSYETKYGRLFGISSCETYTNGQIKAISLKEENTIETKCGAFVPQYTDSDILFERQKKYRHSITFHDNGEVKAIALEKQSVVKTPLGEYPAELVTFYNDGSLNRIFPLNGKITGFWSEEDEGKIAQVYPFKFEFGEFESKIISLRFYPKGQLKSMTLWPGSSVTLNTPIGSVEVRNGFALYKDGKIKSVEPAKPIPIHTKIGSFLSYDHQAVGIHGDTNSLVFDESGHLYKFTTATNGLEVKMNQGQLFRVGPREVPSYTDVTKMMILPVQITFDKDKVIIYDGIKHIFDINECQFKVFVSELAMKGECSDCSSCDSCK